MRNDGYTGSAIPDTRAVPLPRIVEHAGNVTGQPRRDPLAASPFRGQPIVEFTPEQLAAAGYQVTGPAKPKRKNAAAPKARKQPDRTYPTHFDHAAAVAQYVAGETSAQVGARHGVSAAAVLNAVRAAGEQVRVGRRQPSTTAPEARRMGRPVSAPVDDIVRRYTVEQATVPQIAAAVGVSVGTVRRVLHAADVTLRDDRSNRPNSTNRIPEATLREAGELYATGLTRRQVADQLGVTTTVVDKGIAHTGTPVRPSANRPGGHAGVDHSAALKDLMAANEITSAQVRAWARATGRECSDVGIPSRRLVEDYLLANNDRKASA